MTKKNDGQELVSGNGKIIFMWDATNCNPNGDSKTNNVRKDGEYLEVSNERMNRTWRDFAEENNHKILISKKTDKSGCDIADEYIKKAMEAEGIKENPFKISKKTKESKENEIKIQNYINKEYLDSIFGYVMPIGGSNKTSKKKDKTKITSEEEDGSEDVEIDVDNSSNEKKKGDSLTFHRAIGEYGVLAKSIHKVCIDNNYSTSNANVSKTGNDASGDHPKSIVKYANIVSEKTISYGNARNLGITNDDIKRYMIFLWKSTNGLSSASKTGQESLCMIYIKSKLDDKGNPYGPCVNGIFKNELIKMNPLNELSEDKVRRVTEYHIDVTRFMDELCNNKYKIDEVLFYHTKHVIFDDNQISGSLSDIFKNRDIEFDKLEIE